MRHDGRADNADRDRERAGVGQSRNDAAEPRRGPVDRGDDHLDEIAKGDRRNERADNELGRAKPAAFKHQEPVDEDGGDPHPGDERNVQEQREANRGAEEFGEVGRHRRHFTDDPERPYGGPRKLLAAHFGQIAPSDDAELGRQRLEQHRRDACREHDPQQRIAVSRPGLDVGREIAWVHIGDRGDHRGAGEQERALPTPLAGQRLANARDCAVGHPRGGGGVHADARDVAHRLISCVSRLACIMYPLLRHSQ